jgi:hypothetical protein
MKRSGIKTKNGTYFGLILIVLSAQIDLSDKVYADTYHRRPPRYEYGYQGKKGYTPPPNYAHPSEGYFACPKGDYISDRPGRCPLDGSALVPRGS